jgi:multimeric flavodoxin WrbA
MDQFPKILGVSCSPREGNSRSEEMLRKFMDYVEEFGGEPSTISLANKKISSCEGCYSETVSGEKCVFPCLHKDDTNQVLDLIIDCDGLVLATPIYWGGSSSLLRILIEKMTAIENNRQEIMEKTGREPLEGKPFVLLASQDSEGASLAHSQTVWGLNHMGMLLLPNSLIFEPALLERPIVRAGLRLMGIRKFEWIDNSIRLAARNIVLFADLLKKSDFRFDDYKVTEPKA